MTNSIGKLAFRASVGTMGSRMLGFIRNVVLAAAVGTGLTADAYNVANNIPNTIFLLIGGGTISAVFVPQLVAAAAVSRERENQYGSLLILAGLLVGVALSICLLFFNKQIIEFTGGGSWSESQTHAAYLLSLWCIPQVVFYVLYLILSQILNARGKFEAVAWLPSINSLAVILACAPIIIIGSVDAGDPDSLKGWPIMLLGGGTLAGTVLQAGVLYWMLRRAGFCLRLPSTLRGFGFKTTLHIGVWALVGTCFYQSSNLMVMVLATRAGAEADRMGYEGHGFTAVMYARTLIYVAQAVTTTSIANVLLQRLSRRFREGDNFTASSELNEVLLRVGSAIFPVGGAMFALGPLIGLTLFGYGKTSAQAALFIGDVISVFALGLIPFAIQTLILRPFYARQEAIPPLLSAITISLTWIGLSTLCAKILEPHAVALGLAAAFSLAYLVDLPWKFRRLNLSFGFSVSPDVRKSYIRMFLAASISATVIILLQRILIDQAALTNRTTAIFSLIAFSLSFITIYHLITRNTQSSIVSLARWMMR